MAGGVNDLRVVQGATNRLDTGSQDKGRLDSLALRIRIAWRPTLRLQGLQATTCFRSRLILSLRADGVLFAGVQKPDCHHHNTIDGSQVFRCSIDSTTVSWQIRPLRFLWV
jgi:hypothetical protein